MKKTNLTNKQLGDLDLLFELVSQRQLKDFGNISASNKADGSLLTSCDLWSDKTIVDGLASIAPGEGVLSEEGGKFIPNTKAYWVVDPLDGTTNFAAGIPYWSISIARFVDGKPQSSFLIIPTLKKKFVSIKGCLLYTSPSPRDSCESSKESVRLSRLRYDVGISTLKDVLVRQSELSNAKSKNINAIYNYNLNLDELERLTFIDKSKNCLGSNNPKIKNTDSICNLER